MLLEIALSQILAWNAKDLNKLLTYYGDDIKVYLVPDEEPKFDCKAMLEGFIKKSFADGSTVPVRVLEKEESPPKVKLLEEKVYPDHVARAWVTYLIENGKIQKMWIELVK